MRIPWIKDKHSLVDLARYGSKPRRHIHSDVLIGGYPEECPMFKEGDILDGNATFNLILCAYDQDRVYKMVSEEIERFEKDVTETTNTINNGYLEMTNAFADINNSIEQTKEKHDQDMQQMRLYITEEIDRNTTNVVYDGLEENLIVYNVKHG